MESAAKDAHRCGLFLFEAFALRDLKLCVLDKMGHSKHASCRLGVALRLLTGPAELLTPMMKGLDAAELMALPPPEAGYEVVYSTDDQALAELRRELHGLRLMALQKRAMSEGADKSAVTLAVDSCDPKNALIELLLQSHASVVQADGVRMTNLRHELSSLTLMALQKRAAGAGFSDEQLESAVDSNQPKDALIGMLVSAGDTPSVPAHKS